MIEDSRKSECAEKRHTGADETGEDKPRGPIGVGHGPAARCVASPRMRRDLVQVGKRAWASIHPACAAQHALAQTGVDED
jgi:hypothetical protein